MRYLNGKQQAQQCVPTIAGMLWTIQFSHIIPLSYENVFSLYSYLLTLVLFVFVPTDLNPKPNKPVKPPPSGGGEC